MGMDKCRGLGPEHSLDEVDIVVNPDTNGEEWMTFMHKAICTEGWAVSEYDYAVWAGSHPDFWFLMAIDKASDTAVGGVTLTRTPSTSGDSREDLYTIGMYYVHPNWRLSGIGSKMFNKVMTIAGEHNIGLCAVPQMSVRYADVYGFNKFLEHKHQFGEIKILGIVLPKRDENVRTKRVEEVDYSLVHTYDKTVFPNFDRYNYMRDWLHSPGAHSRVSIDVSGEVTGVCCVRETALNKLFVGPLYADSEAIARSLLLDTLSSMVDWKSFKGIRFATTQYCPEAMKMFVAMNRGEQISTVDGTMQYTGHIVAANYQKAYSIMDTNVAII